MKFCRDCKHHLGPSPAMAQTSEFSPHLDFSRCGHDIALDRSVFLVTGRPEDIRRLYASTQRLPNSPCGPEANLWEGALEHELAPSDYPSHAEARGEAPEEEENWP